MVANLLWTSRKIGNHFAESNQIKNLVVILLTPNKSKNLVVILLLIVAYWTLPIYVYLSKSSLVWGGSFKMHFLREQFWSVPVFWEIKKLYSA